MLQKSWLILQDDYAIVYLDFKVDVKRFVKRLRKAGLHDREGVSWKKMCNEMNSKVDKEFEARNSRSLSQLKHMKLERRAPTLPWFFE